MYFGVDFWDWVFCWIVGDVVVSFGYGYLGVFGMVMYVGVGFVFLLYCWVVGCCLSCW